MRKSSAVGIVLAFAVAILGGGWEPSTMTASMSGEVLWAGPNRLLVATKAGPVPVDVSRIPRYVWQDVEPGDHVWFSGAWSDTGLMAAHEFDAAPGLEPVGGR